jgi:hypothetical protein
VRVPDYLHVLQGHVEIGSHSSLCDPPFHTLHTEQLRRRHMNVFTPHKQLVGLRHVLIEHLSAKKTMLTSNKNLPQARPTTCHTTDCHTTDVTPLIEHLSHH